jgi:hypothetical protein
VDELKQHVELQAKMQSTVTLARLLNSGVSIFIFTNYLAFAKVAHGKNRKGRRARLSSSHYPTRKPSPANVLLRRRLSRVYRIAGRMVPQVWVRSSGDTSLNSWMSQLSEVSPEFPGIPRIGICTSLKLKMH